MRRPRFVSPTPFISSNKNFFRFFGNKLLKLQFTDFFTVHIFLVNILIVHQFELFLRIFWCYLRIFSCFQKFFMWFAKNIKYFSSEFFLFFIQIFFFLFCAFWSLGKSRKVEFRQNFGIRYLRIFLRFAVEKFFFFLKSIPEIKSKSKRNANFLFIKKFAAFSFFDSRFRFVWIEIEVDRLLIWKSFDLKKFWFENQRRHRFSASLPILMSHEAVFAELIFCVCVCLG